MIESKFQILLMEQLSLLSDACISFDEGKIRQIKSIAARSHTICHDIVRIDNWREWSKSRDINLVSTVSKKDMTEGIVSYYPLSGYNLNGTFIPLGDNPTVEGQGGFEYLRLSKWWNQKVIGMRERRMSRKNIIFQMRNYDGGAHGIDKDPSGDYTEISKNRSMGWFNCDEQGNELPNVTHVSALECTVRQIGHEIIRSFQPHLESKFWVEMGYPDYWNVPAQISTATVGHISVRVAAS